jgi:hypothetical protein
MMRATIYARTWSLVITTAAVVGGLIGAAAVGAWNLLTRPRPRTFSLVLSTDTITMVGYAPVVRVSRPRSA